MVTKSFTPAWALAIATILAIGLPSGIAPAQKAATSAATVIGPWARATPGGSKVGAAFLTIKGGEMAPDRLLAATSPVAGSVELHTHVHDGGVMRMRRVERIDIPKSTNVILKPGGYHIMLFDLKTPLKEGQTIELTLTFDKAGKISVEVPVLKIGSPGPSARQSGHGSAGHGSHTKH